MVGVVSYTCGVMRVRL